MYPDNGPLICRSNFYHAIKAPGIGYVSDYIESWQSFGQAVQTLFQLEENFSKDRNGSLLPKLF